MGRYENGDRLKKALLGIEELKKKTYINKKKNEVTISNLKRHFGISRNNFSKRYIKEYPEWENIRKAIDDFKIEFNEMEKKGKDSPVISDLTNKLDTSLEQNLELIREHKQFAYQLESNQRRIDDLLIEKRELELKLKRYIEKFGLFP